MVWVYVCPIHRLRTGSQDGEQHNHMALTFLSNRGRRAVRCFLLGCLIVGGAPFVRAELRFDVFLGYDGTVREAAWFPVTCEIFNDGPPINGFIEVAPTTYGKGQTQRLPIELPTGTTKRVIIPAFSSSRYAQTWDVRLVDSRGRLIEESVATRAQRSVGWETKLVGVLPRTAAGTVALRSIKRNQQPDMQPTSVRFQPAMFPDNPLVLEGLDAVYLNSEIATSLRASQANALLAWMNAGGHLIVAIEQVSDVTGVPWLRNALPCEPADIVGVGKHFELQEWLEQGTTATNFALVPSRRNRVPAPVDQANLSRAAFDDLRSDPVFEAAEIRVVTGKLRDGRPLVSVGEHPLVVTGNRGLGRVTVLMFSPEREPFKGWKNLPTFWTKLVEVPLDLYVSSDYYPGYGQSVDGLFGALIDSRQVHKLPVGWLLILLLVYLVVIGPLDRIWLKKINRPMLTWITFPCYVMFFSGLIYLIGYKLRAGESEYSELHLVDVLPRGERTEWRGRTYASIYSPANAKYPMRSELKFATLRGEYLSSRGGETTEKGTLLHTGDNFKADVFVPVWTSQLYLSDWWHAGSAPLAVTLKPVGDGWNLTVENLLGKPINAARLAMGDMIYHVGEILPGQSKTIQLGSASGRGEQIENFVRNNVNQYRGPVQQRQYAFGHRDSGTIDDAATASIVASLLGELDRPRQDLRFVSSPGLDLSPVIARGDAVLFAYVTNSAPIPTLNQTKAKRSASNTLWRIPISAGQ
jgi:hypothetical protein